MDWDKLRIFHAVASAGSFTHAGQMLTLSQSAVSRQISALEEEISTPLFQRHARGLTLTDEGELLYSAVSDVLARLAAAEEALKNIHDSPRGSLKITASHGIGAYWLLPRLKEFLKEFPEVEIHLVMDDRELDLSQRDADLAIRMRAPVQADLIQRKLFTVHYHMYASKAYLASNPRAANAGGYLQPHHHRLWRDGGAGNPRHQLAAGALPEEFPSRLHRQRHPHQQHHRHPAGGGSGPGDRRGARFRRGRSTAIWCGCCRKCPPPASTCIWSMPTRCASPSGWRRSATSWSRVPRTGNTEADSGH